MFIERILDTAFISGGSGGSETFGIFDKFRNKLRIKIVRKAD